MSTKQKVLVALYKKAPGATLHILDEGFGFQVQVEAPRGHHWDGDVHCRCLPEWLSGPRSEYWDIVLEEITKDLPEPRLCTDDDCEGISVWGECEYWDETF